MGAKHTPGPWRVRNDVPKRLHFDEDTRFWVITDSEGYSPAIVPPWDAVPPLAAEEAKANARLIAAAPELLEAAKEVLHFHESGGHEGDLEEALRLTRAAIDKARGQ